LFEAEQPVLCLKRLPRGQVTADGSRIVIEPWANDPDDDGNAIVGVRNAVLIELAFVTLVTLVVLLLWLF
jgi:hypothetical protein